MQPQPTTPPKQTNTITTTIDTLPLSSSIKEPNIDNNSNGDDDLHKYTNNPKTQLPQNQPKLSSNFNRSIKKSDNKTKMIVD